MKKLVQIKNMDAKVWLAFATAAKSLKREQADYLAEIMLAQEPIRKQYEFLTEIERQEAKKKK